MKIFSNDLKDIHSLVNSYTEGDSIDDYLKQYWISIYPKKNNKPSSNDRVVLTGLSLKELLDKLSSN